MVFLVSMMFAVLAASDGAPRVSRAATCPDSVFTETSLTNAPLAWDVGNTHRVAKLESMSFYVAPPLIEREGRLVEVFPQPLIMPDNPGAEMLSFSAANDGLWVVCRYNGTNVMLAMHLPWAKKCQSPRGKIVERTICSSG
jgi:hypothetical protein